MSENKDDNLNIDDLDLFAGQEEVYEIVTLTEDDGTQTDYYVMDGIDVEKDRYLLLVKTSDFELEEPEAFLFKEINQDSENCIYEPVEDEDEYNKVVLLLQDEDSEYEMKF